MATLHADESTRRHAHKRGRRAAKRRRPVRTLRAEPLEPRLLLTANGVMELSAQTLDLVIDRPYDGLVATFKSDGAVSNDFAAIIDWQDSDAPTVERDLHTSGMVRPHGDRFGVFAQHIYGTAHDYDFQVTVYDIDESTPVAASDTGLAHVVDGDESFTRATMRGLPENLLLVEGQPFSDPVLVFTDTNSAPYWWFAPG